MRVTFLKSQARVSHRLRTGVTRRVLFLAGAVSLLTLVGCAPTGPRFVGLADVPPEGALIYYVRSPEVVGSGVRYRIFENGVPLYRTAPARYFVHATTPGLKVIEASTETTTKLVLYVQKGERYFVETELKTGGFIARPDLRQITESEALPLLREAYEAEPETP